MSRVNRSITIKVRDRATLFNLLVGLNGVGHCKTNVPLLLCCLVILS